MDQGVAIVGAAVQSYRGNERPKLDEIAFDVSDRALREAGVKAQDVGFSVLCSLDLYDGRGISNGLISPAAAGYLDDEIRIQLDATAAIIAAAAGLRARKAELAIVVAVSCPEVAAGTTDELRRFTDQISSYTFDSHFNRPVGLSATSALALHAAAVIDRGEVTIEELAQRAAADIRRGAATSWAGRGEVTPEEVLAADAIAWPLTELMLPAESMGAVAVVLGSEPRARRAKQIRAWLTGWSSATTWSVAEPRWLDDPFGTTAAAAERACARAGVDDIAADIDLVEMTALTPALTPQLLSGLGLPTDFPPERINPSGGVLSSFPGVANGALRLVEALDGLRNQPGTSSSGRRRRALVHGMDNLMGPIASTTSVLVLEQA